MTGSFAMTDLEEKAFCLIAGEGEEEEKFSASAFSSIWSIGKNKILSILGLSFTKMLIVSI